MDHQSSGLDFALIGHQDSWKKISDYVRLLRLGGPNSCPGEETIREIYPYIPPRPLFEIIARDVQSRTVRGIYVETFISPDELDAGHLFKNLDKVKQACTIASTCGARVAALGGFTSIVLESGGQSFEKMENTWFTTGNTLTSSFIVEAIEKACHQKNILPPDCNLLVIGSTGDIGSACVRYFTNRVKELRLCARREEPLQKQALEVGELQQPVRFSRDINELLPGTNVVICAASSLVAKADFDLLPGHAIVCDAGYPKNIPFRARPFQSYFWGGLGRLAGAYDLIPGNTKSLYGFSIPNVIHGCLLEAIVLAFSRTGRAFSKGRGNITPGDMRFISNLARTHGITVAPLFNDCP